MFTALVKTFHDHQTKRYYILNVSIIFIVILNIFTILLESTPSIHPTTKLYLYYINIGFSIIFAIEYIIRHLTEKRFFLKLFYPLSIIDFIAIFPPLICNLLGFDISFLNTLRLLRIIKVFQHSKTMQLLGKVFLKIYKELFFSFLLIAIITIICAFFMYHAEHAAQPDAFSSVAASLWWAVATITTVGYGDLYPVTTSGKVIATIVALFGVGVFAIPTGLVSAAFIDEFRDIRQKKQK